tara:strand:+ start:699 stop:1328 length:630 start_codon:yes stop_codon:yes gene_type:complete
MFNLENYLIILFPIYYSLASLFNSLIWMSHYINNSHLLLKIIPNVAFNIWIVTPVILKITFIINPIYVLYKKLFIEIIEIIVNIIIIEVSFYSFHRLFHVPILYKYHKQHHSIKDVIGIAAVYCHWSEMIFVNLSGFIISHIVFSHSFLHLMFIMIISITNTIFISHSISTSTHSNHHLKFNVNYGVLHTLDYYFGTTDIVLPGNRFFN